MPRREDAFLPVTRADDPLLRRRLAEPHGRACRRAGFDGDRILPREDGDPVIVMEFRRS